MNGVQLTLEGALWRPERPSAGSDEYAVLECLERVYGLAWSREQLCAQTGLPDRAVRASVEALRRMGYPIVLGKPVGYRLAWDEPEAVRKLAALLKRRATTELETATAMLRSLDRGVAA